MLRQFFDFFDEELSQMRVGKRDTGHVIRNFLEIMFIVNLVNKEEDLWHWRAVCSLCVASVCGQKVLYFVEHNSFKDFGYIE